MDKGILKYRIAVMQAYLDGEEIENKDKLCHEWVTAEPMFDWEHYVYRVKRKPRVIYVLDAALDDTCGPWYKSRPVITTHTKFVEELNNE